MHSWEIQKWQDNVAEDVKNKKLGRENEINATLEVAYQLAKLREDLAKRELTVVVQVPTEAHSKWYNFKMFRWIKFSVEMIRRW